MRKILVVGLCLLSLCGTLFVGPAQAAEGQWTPEQSSQRINIAGRQRMLSQRMTKAVCFTLSGVDHENQRQIAEASALEFADRIDLLRDGDPEMGLGPETNPETLAALADVHALSQPLVSSVLQLSAGDLQSVAMALVINRNLPTLVRMNETVGLIERQAGGKSMSPDVATTINLAGRQRMLSQRIAKTLCLITADMAVQASLTELEAAVVMFHKTLLGLIDGDARANVLPPPTAKIAGQLKRVEQEWA